MDVFKTIAVILVISANLFLCDAQKLPKEAYSTVSQLITAAGYPYEKHRAYTPDGYILQVHRIPAGRRTPRKTQASAKGKRAVLLVHGLFGHSGDFVIMGPHRSLAYLLADAGYDVWMANMRGNLYTTHESLTRNDPKFWEYSFHEHAKYDIPATIDKILNITGLPKVFYVGYSMGGTSFFAMMAERPEYNEKVSAFVGLAPAVYLDNLQPLVAFALRTMDITNIMRRQGMMSMSLRPELLEFLIGRVCNMRNLKENWCMRIVYSVIGEDFEQNDWEMTPVIMARFQPASWRQLEHYGKIALTGVFTSWEDGLNGRVKPYDLRNVKVPVTLLYGENDQLTEKSEIMRLAQQLNNTGVLEDVKAGCSWPKFNHLDFVFAKDVGELLNKPLVKYIDKMHNKYIPT